MLANNNSRRCFVIRAISKIDLIMAVLKGNEFGSGKFDAPFDPAYILKQWYQTVLVNGGSIHWSNTSRGGSTCNRMRKRECRCHQIFLTPFRGSAPNHFMNNKLRNL